MAFGLPAEFRRGIHLVTAGAILSVFALVVAGAAAGTGRGHWSVWHGLHLGLFGVAALAFYGSLRFWNILWYKPS